MKQKLLKIKSIPYMKYFLGIVITNLVIGLSIVILRGSLPPTVPLFYGLPRGEEQLAPQMFLLLPPAISVLIAVVNTTVSSILEDKFLQKIFIGVSFATTLLSTITIIRIVLLVGAI